MLCLYVTLYNLLLSLIAVILVNKAVRKSLTHYVVCDAGQNRSAYSPLPNYEAFAATAFRHF